MQSIHLTYPESIKESELFIIIIIIIIINKKVKAFPKGTWR